MFNHGINKKFIEDCSLCAKYYDGVYDLIKLWDEEDDVFEKYLIRSDISQMIGECLKTIKEQ